MKIEKRSNGSYRVRKMHNGKAYTLTFPYKPSQKEVVIRISDMMQEEINHDVSNTFEYYAKEYVKNRTNVLSPSSVRTYNRLINSLSDNFRNKSLYDITQSDVQREMNLYAKDHAPKTVRSLHGFVASVLGSYRPQLVLRTTLPQKIIKDRYLPTEEDIKAILKASKDTDDHIAIQLGILSLRRSEICALELSDLQGNELHVHSSLVYNKKWIKKEAPKTDAGNRVIYLPDSLVEEIKAKGYFFKYSPNKLLEHLNKYQDQLNIPRFRFHDLRHYFASYASTVMPESDAMALGGWKSDYVFKSIYRESMKDKRKESAQKYLNQIFLEGKSDESE